MTKEQLGELIIDSEDTLYRVARSLLRNETDQVDAISEAIVRAFASLGQLREDARAKAWLIRIVKSECFNIMRKEKRLVPLDTAPEMETGADPDAFRDLYEAMDTLPEKMRLAITLHYMEGYSVREIAEIEECSESAVKMNLCRGREKLEAALRKQTGGPTTQQIWRVI